MVFNYSAYLIYDMSVIIKSWLTGIPFANKKTTVLLTGYIIDSNGGPVTERGFYYGDSPSLGESIVSSDTTESFSAQVVVGGDVLFYQAYAVNDFGVGAGEIKSIIL